MSEYLEVVVDSIRVSLTSQQRVIVLKDLNDEIYLPIWIGTFEAESIVVALQQIEVSRPQTHDLLRSVIEALNAKLKRVELSKIQADTFYSNLVLEVNEQEFQVDCRPSDAISLAIRCRVPILVDMDVLVTAGIREEKDIRLSQSVLDDVFKPVEPEEPYDSSQDENLSVFDDFLRNIDLGGSENDDDSDTDEPKDDQLPF